MMVQVVDGEIVARYLPKTGVLSDGRLVSNYHQLPPSILEEEGWVTVTDLEEPEYDPETQHTSWDLELQADGSVVRYFEIHDLPPPEPLFEAEVIQEVVRFVVQKDLASKISADQFNVTENPQVAILFPPLNLNGVAVVAGEIYRWASGLVEVIQSHTTQPDRPPEDAPALFKLYFDPDRRKHDRSRI